MISLFKNSILVILVLFTILALTSCGATKSVLDVDTFNSFQKLGVAPYEYFRLPNDFPKTDFVALTTICDDTILTNLKQLRHIKEITKVLDDTLYTMYSNNDTAIYEFTLKRSQ